MRVMKRVMKPLHHPSHAIAPISIEMKVSSPPRLLPQAEGNFRQQHFLWQLTGGSAERFGSTASLAARTNYPQPAVAPASHCLSSGAGSLTLRAWGRTGALRLITLRERIRALEPTRIKKGSPITVDPKFVKNRQSVRAALNHHRLANRKSSRGRFDSLALTAVQLTKESVEPIDVYQRDAWIPLNGLHEIVHRELFRNVRKHGFWCALVCVVHAITRILWYYTVGNLLYLEVPVEKKQGRYDKVVLNIMNDLIHRKVIRDVSVFRSKESLHSLSPVFAVMSAVGNMEGKNCS